MESEKKEWSRGKEKTVLISSILTAALAIIIPLDLYTKHRNAQKLAADYTSEVRGLASCLSERAANILRGGNETQPFFQHTNLEYQIDHCEREQFNLHRNDEYRYLGGSNLANREMHNCLDDRVDDIYEANERSTGMQDVKNIIQRCATHVQENFDTNRLGRSETVSMPEGRFGK